MSLSPQTNDSAPGNYEDHCGGVGATALHGWVLLDSGGIRGDYGLYKCGDLQDILHLTVFVSLVCY